MFAFAGLWEHWEQDSETVCSCTLITTAANEKMQTIHNRMPVVLEQKNYGHWLDLSTSKETLLSLFSSDDAYSGMAAIPVSNWVNNPRHNDVNCIKPLSKL